MSYKILSEIVRKKREKLNITQEELADSLGVSRQTISHWESGHIEHMSIDKLGEYARVLELSEEAFIHPEIYLEMDRIQGDYIELAKKLQDNNISVKQVESFIELVTLIRLDLFNDMGKRH